MSADVLNALGYTGVEPMAAAGGADGGQDIKFKEGETPGVALVTLDKNIRGKFKRDLAKQPESGGVIALFCNVDVSRDLKLEFARDAVAKGFRIEIFDLERLRSLLDSSLKDVRQRYLRIDDDIATRLRSEVIKLLRFPDAFRADSAPSTMIEGMLADKTPAKLFDLLMRYDQQDVSEVPGIGSALVKHLTTYYKFRQEASRVENDMITRIGGLVMVRFRQGWTIYYQYAILRFGGMSKEAIFTGGNFLNYGITWDDADRVLTELSNDPASSSEIKGLFTLHEELVRDVNKLLTLT